MDPLRPSARIYLAPSRLPHAGRGVFAVNRIKTGEVIEVCPVLKLPAHQRQLLNTTNLFNYYFLWGEKQEHMAIALGFGSLYNHSYHPNAAYRKDYKHQTLIFRALTTINPGEEILVNYNGDPNNHSPLWIKSIPSV